MKYRGNCIGHINGLIAAGRPLGPNYFGELMWPISATYNPDTDTTTVAFTLVQPQPKEPTS